MILIQFLLTNLWRNLKLDMKKYLDTGNCSDWKKWEPGFPPHTVIIDLIHYSNPHSKSFLA